MALEADKPSPLKTFYEKRAPKKKATKMISRGGCTIACKSIFCDVSYTTAANSSLEVEIIGTKRRPSW